MAGSNPRHGFEDLVEDVTKQNGENKVYKDLVFSASEVARFQGDVVWTELNKRLLERLSYMFHNWMFTEDRDEQNKLRGQAIEICYLLKTPSEMVAQTAPEDRPKKK